MKKNILISVIIPVYNVECYLKRCVDSVICQTYRNLEIILVDDGSPDSCGTICDEYAELDKRIIVLHKENGGLSDARNAGIQIAKGQYLGFVDSDDYIEPDMFETLLCDALEFNSDISMCGFYDVFKQTKAHYPYIERQVLNVQDGLYTCLMTKKMGVTAWNKLYKRSLFEQVRYPKGKTTEDAFVIVDLFSQCKKVSINTKPLYYYVHRAESITTKKYATNDWNVVYAYEYVVSKIGKNFPNLIDLAKARLLWAYLVLLDKSILSDETEVNIKIQKYIRTNIKDIFHPFFTKSRRMSAFVACVSLNLYKQLVIHYRRK